MVIMLISSISVVMILGFFLSFYGVYEFGLSFDTPAFAAVIKGERRDTIINETANEAANKSEQAEAVTMDTVEAYIDGQSGESPEEQSGEESKEESTGESTEDEYISNEITMADGSIRILPTEYIQYEEWNDNPPQTVYCDNPGIRPITSEYDYIQLADGDFANTLFIGDSRISGLHSYSGYEGATFLYKTGLSIYGLMEDTLEMGEGKKTTTSEILRERDFENIYIMVGINELGVGTSARFGEKYGEVLGAIRRLQPKARIIIMSIMFVTNGYTTHPDIFNNDNINSRNAAIAPYANGRTIFYLDINPAVVDDTGGLNPEYTFDGVHLKAQYYKLLTEYINAHGLKPIMASGRPKSGPDAVNMGDDPMEEAPVEDFTTEDDPMEPQG